jgi:hypothetical protein
MEHAILIIKEEDFRVPIGQGQEAFQAAQLRGIKVGFIFSRRKPLGSETQNAQVWQKNSSNG